MCVACWKPVFETVVYTLSDVFHVAGVCYDHHTTHPNKCHSMDLDPDTFYPVANLIGIMQLEWEVQDDNPWGMQPNLELTWGLDGVSEQTPLVEAPLNPLFQVILWEQTPFITFSALLWLDSLLFQLATCYVNKHVH